MGVCKSSNPLHISHIAWFVTTRCGANPPEFGPILALSPGPIFILSFGPLSGSILGLSLSLHLGSFLEPRVSMPSRGHRLVGDSAGSECFAPQRPVPWPVNVLVSSRAHHLVAALVGVRMMPCAAPARSPDWRQRPLRDVNISYEYAPMGTVTRHRMGVRRRNYYTIPQRACKTRMRGTV